MQASRTERSEAQRACDAQGYPLSGRNEPLEGRDALILAKRTRQKGAPGRLVMRPRVTSSTAPPEEDEMGRTLAAFVVAASLLTLASSEASAWVCYATGLGSGGYARAYDIIDAKLFALRRCERNSPVPVCTLLWCRPGR